MSSAEGQAQRLERPEEVLPDAFSFVRGVRELPDGTVLVADYVDQRVLQVNLRTGETRTLVSEGEGPAHVRLPMGLVPFTGDSTLVIDYGNNRLLVLATTGRVVRSMVVTAPGRLFPRGVDASGALVYAIPAWSEGARALPDDSVRLVRWRPPQEETRQVAVVQGTRARRDRGPSMEPRIPIVGYAAQDAWVVGTTGTLVIVRANPYRLEFVDAAGGRRLGPVQPVASRSVTVEDKRRFVRDFAAASPMSGRGPGGGMGRAPLPSAREVARLVEITEWATHHPPFDPGGVLAAPDGRTWVRRSTDPATGALYDVFDASGALMRQVTLARGRRVALVGRRGVYVVAEGEDGVQSLERYRLP